MTCCQMDDGLKMRLRAKAGVCAVCVGDRPRCPASGKAVAVHVRGEPCPRGKHPADDGRVRWLGLWWLGLPWPKRVWLWTTRYSERDPGAFLAAFPGCGCVQVLKGWWQRLETAL